MEQDQKSGEGEQGLEGQITIPAILPVLPLMNTVIYPHMVAPLLVLRQKSLRCIDEAAIKEPKLLALVTQKGGTEEEPSGESLYRVGTAGVLLQMLKMPDGGARVIVRGMQRIRIVEIITEEPMLTARVEPIEEVVKDSVQLQALSRAVVNLFQRMVSLLPNAPEQVNRIILNINDPGRLADFVAVFEDDGGVEAYPAFGAKLEEKSGKIAVKRVWPDSAAEDAGLAAGDVIMDLAGWKPPDLPHLRLRLANLRWGDRLDLAVERNGERVFARALLEPLLVETERRVAPHWQVKDLPGFDPSRKVPQPVPPGEADAPAPAYRLVERDGKMVADCQGFILEVPASRAAVYRQHLGKEVILGMRPEDIHDPEFTPPGITRALVEAKVDVTELMGHEVIVYLVTEHSQFLGRFDPRTGVRVGNVIHAAFDMDRMHVFDKQTELAIR